MTTLDYEKFIDALSIEMQRKTEERNHASRNEWFEKAAKLDNEIEGIRKARFLATSGDYHTKGR